MSHPARVYVDESYGDDNSFVIQAAIALPAGDCEDAFNDALDRKIRENPRFDRNEFKGQDVSGRNHYIFQWFLQQAVNVLALIAERTPCRTTVSIDGGGMYRSEVYERLHRQLKGSLADIGYPDTEIGIARDFIRQVIWLHARLPRLIPPVRAGGVELIFDAKHKMDESFEEEVVAWIPRGTAKLRFAEKRRKAYTRLLQILLRVLPSSRDFPDVLKFTYMNSKSSHLIQAADLLSNLTLNAIKHRAGVTNPTIRMKYEMLCSVMNRDPVDDELLKSFDVSGAKLLCRNQELFSSITLTA